jgi:hypothetical protein
MNVKTWSAPCLECAGPRCRASGLRAWADFFVYERS